MSVQKQNTLVQTAQQPLPAARSVQWLSQGSSRVISLGTVLVCLSLWIVATEMAWVSSLFLPAPKQVWQALVQAWRGDIQGGEALWAHAKASAWRVGLAFFLAVLVAVPVGLAMGINRIWRGIFDPAVEFYRPLPPLAYLPLIVIWFGIDEFAKVLLIFLACFAPLALAARAGVARASEQQVYAVLSLGASRWQLLRWVIWPAALTDIFVGLRIAAGFAWTTLVAAEMIAATQGLGQLVLNASNFLRTDIVMAGIILIGLLAMLFDCALRCLEHYSVPWKGH